MKVVLEAIDGAILMQSDTLLQKLTLENVRPIVIMLHQFQIEPPLQICDMFLQRNSVSKNIDASGDDVMFAQTFHLERFLPIAIEHLIQKDALAAFVSERGAELNLNSWKIITLSQSSDHRKYIELKNIAKDIIKSLSSTAEWNPKIHAYGPCQREPGPMTMTHISLLENYID